MTVTLADPELVGTLPRTIAPLDEASPSKRSRRSLGPVAVTLKPSPDLVVSSVSGPASAESGQTASVTWTVSNTGPAAAQGTWTDTLYISMPLIHGNALFGALFPALASGARVALRDRFSASAWLDDIRKYD